jgi:hypothetical protein
MKMTMAEHSLAVASSVIAIDRLREICIGHISFNKACPLQSQQRQFPTKTGINHNNDPHQEQPPMHCQNAFDS